MDKAEWIGNPVCWWLALYFCSVWHIEHAKESTKIIKDNTLQHGCKYKINIQNELYILFTNNEQFKNEIKKSSFTTE